ncbi:dTMP kinase [Telmatospirillum sp.]|uniref:dTMP kinase n=1 Tax=Telmatospirillum sp. TaxID=2079197 RepID=UPI002847FEB1|nr:dTMP kinase [Telmatospirillum sp.]MDR3435458.1 dTMP kinase [Telmatospirillum sp.]
MAQGYFVTFEGGEGAGKSTQLRLLAEALRRHGIPVVTTREPGGSAGAEQIRSLLVEGETGRWDSMTEALLHFAARRDHVARTVWPALAEGQWVLCDRFADSTLAYQGYGHGLPHHAIEQLYDMTIGAFAPDLTLILDLPVEEGLRRATGRGGDETRYERMGLAFHQRLRQGFLDIAQHHPERCVVLPASASVDVVQVKVLEAVEERLLARAR